MSTRDERDATTRAAWAAEMAAAVARHPSSRGPVRESEMVFTTRDQAEFNRLFTADAQGNLLPPNWQAWADVPEPQVSPLCRVAVWVLLDTAAVLVLLVVGRIVWQGIAAVVGL